MDLVNVRRREVPLEIEFDGGEVLRVVYRPSVWTAALDAELRGQAGTPETEVLVQLLPRVLASWDLTDAGEPVSLTAAALLEVPVPLLAAVLDAVMRHVSPNPETSTRSKGS